MIAILKTRILHWRKQGFSLICWLLLPLLATTIFITIADKWQEDTKIPVGLVVKDNSIMADTLTKAIEATPLIRVEKWSEDVALVKLEQHELDSVFVIEEGYQESIKDNSRNQLLTAYISDMSLAYTPVKEAIASYAQQDAGSSRAAHIVRQMIQHYNVERNWTWDEIVMTSNQIREDESLLHSSFSFHNQTVPVQEENSISLWNVWGIWSFFSLLTTFFLFDWVIKEKQSSIRIRLSFLKMSFKDYLLRNWIVYLILFMLFDFLNIGILVHYFDQSINIQQVLALISYRITISMAAFLFAQCFRVPFYYVVVVIPITILLSVIGGAFIPIEGLVRNMPWVIHLSPVHTFLEGKLVSSWLILLLVVLFIWYWRKEKVYA
ncbi:ABC transporter permease [Aquibacillus kalidii]|uniref:ABC transporter permease n=1 Tax=Aquibacillus kalidii TaxID=2762597 RepID=UPI001F19CCCA|nr:ABC transporter permease [Aquibacillus kalidii]